MGYARFYEMFEVVLWLKVELTAAFNYLDVTTTTGYASLPLTVVVEYTRVQCRVQNRCTVEDSKIVI